MPSPLRKEETLGSPGMCGYGVQAGRGTGRGSVDRARTCSRSLYGRAAELKLQSEGCGGVRDGGEGLEMELCVGCLVENSGLECGAGQRGDKGTRAGEQEDSVGDTWRMAGQHFAEQAGSVEEASQDSERMFLRKVPMVCGVAWERSVP